MTLPPEIAILVAVPDAAAKVVGPSGVERDSISAIGFSRW
jgi:hypothetical protein